MWENIRCACFYLRRMIRKIAYILKKLPNIIEGYKNYRFKKRFVEMIAIYRLNRCKECIFLDNTGKSCIFEMKETPCCMLCGCVLKYKVRSLSDSCPDGRWNAVDEIK